MTRFVDAYDVALLDLDGTVYVGPHAVPYAVESLTKAAGYGMSLIYTTNNAARPPQEVATQLRNLGLTLTDADVVTSSQVAAQRIVRDLGAGARVLAVGGPGVREALTAAGLTVVTAASDGPQAVLQGYGPDVNWRDLAQAAYAIAAGAVHVATNTDMTIPTAGGVAPGNGTLVQTVVTATGKQPVVTGKPYRTMFDFAVEQSGAQRALVVGDRLDTDIEGGTNAELDTLHVLTGVDRVLSLLVATPPQRPTYIARDLRALLEAPVTAELTDSGATCGGWRVDSDGNVVTRGADVVDGIRAAVAVAWSDPAAALDLGRLVDELPLD